MPKTVLLNLLLHLLCFGIVYMLLVFPTGVDSLTEQILAKYQSNAALQRSFLGMAVGHLVWWAFWSLLFGALLSSFWLVAVADRARVNSRTEAQAYTRSWALSLLPALVLSVAIFLFNTNGLVERLLVPGTTYYGLLVGLIAVLAAFWLGTGLFVKHDMQAAVPFSKPLPSVGGR
jgi:predicted neutral ceramidase superfamily lipid hydrolase